MKFAAKKTTAFFGVLAFLAVSVPSANQESPLPDFPRGFKDHAFSHIEYLATMGVRLAGSETAAGAVEYIAEQWRDIGLTVQVEPFDFESYDYSAAELRLGEKSYIPVWLGINPYVGDIKVEGEALLFDPGSDQNASSSADLEGKVVVSSRPELYFQLLFRNPAMMIFLNDEDFPKDKAGEMVKFELSVQGKIRKLRSANVVAWLGPSSPDVPEILLTAHLDSYKGSPGANDNASGVGVLIELARYFKQLEKEPPYRIKFIAFGAEEVGVLGSRIYVARHGEDLDHCLFVLNMDVVGGAGDPIIETMGGVRGSIEEKGKHRFPEYLIHRAWEGTESSWRICAPGILEPFMVSNHPDWLVDMITSAAADLGYDFRAAENMGSDQQTFSQAGIPATSISFGGDFNHTPQDLPEKINRESLEKTGRLVALTVLKAMDKPVSGMR